MAGQAEGGGSLWGPWDRAVLSQGDALTKLATLKRKGCKALGCEEEQEPSGVGVSHPPKMPPQLQPSPCNGNGTLCPAQGRGIVSSLLAAALKLSMEGLAGRG